jgi:hypothetical protein
MKRPLLAMAMVLVAGLTVLAGVLHGRMSNRWGPSPDTIFAANKLKEIPRQFGDWRLQSTTDLDKSSREQLDPAGYFVRTYENQTTGEVVNVTVLLGRPGPISVHTPEICMGSQNYQSRGNRKMVAIRAAAGADDEFWALDFKTSDLRGDLLRVYYGWSAGDRWLAPEDARFWSAGKPYLYKIQLSGILPPGAGPQSDDPCHKFLQDFVPAAKQYLIEPSAR